MDLLPDVASIAPRRPARAWDAWPPRFFRRLAISLIAGALFVAGGVSAWNWVSHSIKARAAYAEGRTNAERAIADGSLILDGTGVRSMEVFVDARTGIPTSEPMMCCVIEEFDEYRRQGFDEEVERAFQAGELAHLDVRAKLRTEAEVLALFEEHADDVRTLDPADRHCAIGDRVVTWSPSDLESPWTTIRVAPQESPDVHPVSSTTYLQLPARALLVDGGTTLLLVEKSSAVQIVDLDRRDRLAWYGGWMSPNPRK